MCVQCVGNREEEWREGGGGRRRRGREGGCVLGSYDRARASPAVQLTFSLVAWVETCTCMAQEKCNCSCGKHENSQTNNAAQKAAFLGLTCTDCSLDKHLSVDTLV